MREYDLIELPNGIRAVHKTVTHTKIAHCAIMLDIGSRDEKPHQQGIAHFWEHMAFKGTQKRKAFHIINRLESLGGELNAYTTKEKICFYASVLDIHLEKAMELLVDIAFNSVFPEKQIEKERQVILEEILMYEDSPEDAIQDQMDEVIFKGHQLANNILGTKESVKNFQKKDFDLFINENLDTSRVIFSSVGNISFRKVEKLVAKYFSEIAVRKTDRKRSHVNNYRASEVSISKKIQQAHCAMGLPSFHLKHKDRIPFFVVNNILGGSSMTSRLNLSIREKYGFVYHIESSFQALTDTGIFSIFYATEHQNLKKSIDLCLKEIKRLQKEKLGKGQLQTVKNQIKGQLAMSEENNTSIMLMLAKSLLDLGEVRSIESIFNEIDNINAEKIQELATVALDIEQLSMLTYIPTE